MDQSTPCRVNLPVLSEMGTPGIHGVVRSLHACRVSSWRHIAHIGEAILAVARPLAGVARVDGKVLRRPQLLALSALSGLLHSVMKA